MARKKRPWDHKGKKTRLLRGAKITRKSRSAWGRSKSVCEKTDRSDNEGGKCPVGSSQKSKKIKGEEEEKIGGGKARSLPASLKATRKQGETKKEGKEKWNKEQIESCWKKKKRRKGRRRNTRGNKRKILKAKGTKGSSGGKKR